MATSWRNFAAASLRSVAARRPLCRILTCSPATVNSKPLGDPAMTSSMPYMNPPRATRTLVDMATFVVVARSIAHVNTCVTDRANEPTRPRLLRDIVRTSDIVARGRSIVGSDAV